MSNRKQYRVGDVIRLPHYETAGGFRVWQVVAVKLGGTKQEGTYELIPLDVHPNETIEVPCLMLETHQGLETPSKKETP